MNWRYAIGKSANNGFQWLLRHSFPGTHFLPNGIIYPFDIKRLYETQKREIKTIFDVGANIGQTSLYLAPWFPTAKLFAFEPISSTFKQLQQNTQHIQTIQCYNHAFGSTTQDLEIVLQVDSETNSLINSAPCNSNAPREKISVQRIDDFCRHQGIQTIDLLKLDVEGYEVEALKGAEKLLSTKRVHFIYAETFFRWEHKNMTPFVDIHRFLYDQGYLLSGFYELCRHGERKTLTCFCNTLYINPHFHET